MTMPRRFFGRGNSLRPINRIKHVFDEQGGIGAGGAQLTTLISAKDSPVIANTTEVVTGSKVNSIFLVVEINATSSAALANAYMYIIKNPGGNLTPPNANTVGSSDNKRFVIHQEMVMLQQVTNSNPRTLFKGVIMIPRGYRRFGPNDLLQIKMNTPGVALNYCLQCHYKEFR